MKSFNEWLSQRELNEISYDVLQRAGDKAFDRSMQGTGPEERATKFWDAAKKRGLNVLVPMAIKRSVADSSGRRIKKILFQANTFKVVDQTKKGWLSKSKPTKIDIIGNDAEHTSLYNFMLRLDLVSGKIVFNYSGVDEDYEVFLDRSSALKLVQAVNEKAGGPLLDMAIFAKHIADVSKIKDVAEEDSEWGAVG